MVIMLIFTTEPPNFSNIRSIKREDWCKSTEIQNHSLKFRTLPRLAVTNNRCSGHMVHINVMQSADKILCDEF